MILYRRFKDGVSRALPTIPSVPLEVEEEDDLFVTTNSDVVHTFWTIVENEQLNKRRRNYEERKQQMDRITYIPQNKLA